MSIFHSDMFAARASLLNDEAAEIGAGGTQDLALELNRIYAEPFMPGQARKHSCIPGVHSTRANCPNNNNNNNNNTHNEQSNRLIVAIDQPEQHELLQVSLSLSLSPCN